MNEPDQWAVVSKVFSKFDDLPVFNTELLRYLHLSITTLKMRRRRRKGGGGGGGGRGGSGSGEGQILMEQIRRWHRLLPLPCHWLTLSHMSTPNCKVDYRK